MIIESGDMSQDEVIRTLKFALREIDKGKINTIDLSKKN